MSDPLEQWISGSGNTLDSAPDAPRALYERLKYVAALLKEAGRDSSGPHLLHRDKDGQVQAIAVAGELVVGREAPAGWAFPDKRLSRLHFRILAAGGGVMRLEDIQSRNGTYVNGEKTVSRELRDGDIIEAGSQVFVFLLPSCPFA